MLAGKAKQVLAVEIDQRFIPILAENLRSSKNVQVVQADILKFDPQTAGLPEEYIVAANIPYYITSAIIRHLLEAKVKPKRIVLTVQEQVAQRIVATPNDMNLLALSVQVYGKPTIEFKIPASAFKPPPEVDSAVVRIELFRQPLIPLDTLDLFFQLAKASFSQKRKTLRNSVSAGMQRETAEVEQVLHSCGIDPMRRAETVSMDEWVQLVKIWKSTFSQFPPENQ